jgi:hypothetical protein
VPSDLRLAQDDDEPRCALCGALAAGPCMSCKRFVCGDCCVLTEGGVETYAICTRCDRRKGRVLSGGWSLVIAWMVGLVVVLALAAGAAVFLLK